MPAIATSTTATLRQPYPSGSFGGPSDGVRPLDGEHKSLDAIRTGAVGLAQAVAGFPSMAATSFGTR